MVGTTLKEYFGNDKMRKKMLARQEISSMDKRVPFWMILMDKIDLENLTRKYNAYYGFKNFI